MSHITLTSRSVFNETQRFCHHHRKRGVYRLELSISSSTGKLKAAAGLGGTIKELVNRAFSYLKAQKNAFGIARGCDRKLGTSSDRIQRTSQHAGHHLDSDQQWYATLGACVPLGLFERTVERGYTTLERSRA